MTDWDGALYDRVSDPQFEWGLRILQRLRLAGDERVLDAGCGSGRLTAELARRVPAGVVVGVDLSPSMLRQAQAAWSPRARLVRADLLHLPFSGRFDVVFSNATFHWVCDPGRLYRQVRLALREGGRLHAQCGGGANLLQLHGRAHELMAEPEFAPWFDGWQEPWCFLEPEMAQRHLEAAGFRDVEATLHERPTAFPSAAEYRDFVTGVVLRPFLNRIGNPAARRRFTDRMVALAGRDDPPHTLDYWRLDLDAVAGPVPAGRQRSAVPA